MPTITLSRQVNKESVLHHEWCVMSPCGGFASITTNTATRATTTTGNITFSLELNRNFQLNLIAKQYPRDQPEEGQMLGMWRKEYSINTDILGKSAI